MSNVQISCAGFLSICQRVLVMSVRFLLVTEHFGLKTVERNNSDYYGYWIQNASRQFDSG